MITPDLSVVLLPLEQIELFAWKSRCRFCSETIIAIISGDDSISFEALFVPNGTSATKDTGVVSAVCGCGAMTVLERPDSGGGRDPRIRQWPPVA